MNKISKDQIMVLEKIYLQNLVKNKHKIFKNILTKNIGKILICKN